MLMERLILRLMLLLLLPNQQVYGGPLFCNPMANLFWQGMRSMDQQSSLHVLIPMGHLIPPLVVVSLSGHRALSIAWSCKQMVRLSLRALIPFSAVCFNWYAILQMEYLILLLAMVALCKILQGLQSLEAPYKRMVKSLE